VLYGDLMT